MIIVIRNGKQSGNTGRTVDIFAWTWSIWGGHTKHTSKQQKNGDFWEELLSENDFEAVLITFCCYDHDAKGSEAVQKIATDQKEHRKCSSCVKICWIAKIYLAINQQQWKMVGEIKLSCTEKRAITGPWWVLYIMEVR